MNRLILLSVNGQSDTMHILLIEKESFLAIKYDFDNANDCDKFIFLMSHADIVKQTAKACSLMLERRKQYFIR